MKMIWILIILFLSGCATQRYWSGYSRGYQTYEAYDRGEPVTGWGVGFLKGWEQAGKDKIHLENDKK